MCGSTDDRDAGLPSTRIRPGTALAIAIAAWFVVFVARLAGPDDLLTRDQERVAAYVLDIVENGNWLAQEDAEGNFASKPPLFNWLAALGTLAFGDTGRVAMAFPSWCATLLCALLVLGVTARAFGRSAGAWAAILYFASMLGLRQVLILRTDALFQGLVFLAALLAFSAFERRRSWLPFWIAATFATLTKGPLVLVLATLGLLAFVRERPFRPRLREHALGLAILVGVCGAWFLAANLATEGRAWQKLIVDELVGHTLGTRENASPPGLHPYRAPAWFVTRLLPMSALAILAFVRVLRAPRIGAPASRLERFFAVQCLAAVVMFAFASEHRFEQLMPLVPGAALLAGHELSRRIAGLSSATQARLRVGAVAVLGFTAHAYLSWWDSRTPPLVQSRNVAEFAAELRPHFRGEERLHRFDAPRGLDAHLARFERPLEGDGLRTRLAERDRPFWIAVVDEAAFRAQLGDAAATRLRVLRRHPYLGETTLSILSDQAALPPASPAPTPPLLPLGAFVLTVSVLLGVAVRRTLATLRAATD